jgi:hypothetical protein
MSREVADQARAAYAERLQAAGGNNLPAYEALDTGLDLEELQALVLPTLASSLWDVMPGPMRKLVGRDFRNRLTGRAWGILLGAVITAVEADRIDKGTV